MIVLPTTSRWDAVPVVRERGLGLLKFTCVVEAALLGVAIVLLRERLLPPRFLSDGELIQQIALGQSYGDSTYTATAEVYASLGLAASPMLAALCSYILALLPMIALGIKLRSRALSWHGVVVAILYCSLAAIYLGYYSKDVWLAPFVAIAILLPRHVLSELLLIAVGLTYAVVFRQYWFIVIALGVGFWVLRPRLTPVSMFTLGALGVSAGSAAIVIILGVEADAFRTGANDNRAGVEVGTIITRFIALDGVAGGVVNNLITYLSLVVPWPLILRPSAYYIVIGLLILYIWILFLSSARSPRGQRDHVERRSISILIAFLVTQALFEPDYGSALRHLTSLLPLLVYLLSSPRRTQLHRGEDLGVEGMR